MNSLCRVGRSYSASIRTLPFLKRSSRCFQRREKTTCNSIKILEAKSAVLCTLCSRTKSVGYEWNPMRACIRPYSTTTAAEPESASETSAEYHCIIDDKETPSGPEDSHEFQAETKMLLDIVAKSLYSEKEVFIRELVSNANDAIEKFRYLSTTEASAFTDVDRPLEIHLAVNKDAKTLTFQDTGIGMTREELVANLGVIAHSGSKAFLAELKNSKGDPSGIIGQFGVGFYSAFMVADKVTVYTRSVKPDSKGYIWTSDGAGSYSIQEGEHVHSGTKVVLHLKPDCMEFCDEDRVKGILKKYSNFVGSPIFLSGKRVNTIQPLWLMDPKEVTPEMHEEFYRFVGYSYDRPRFTLHYRADAPINVRCILYFPEGKPGLFELSRDADIGVALYCRKVLIKHRAESLLPKWLRFVKGVVDSEDIPLNLSRELLQDSAQISKIRTVLSNRVIRFLQDRARKEKESYEEFLRNYGVFFKEGILTSQDQMEKEELSRLLHYESSQLPQGEKVTLAEYCSRMKPGQRDIYYLAAPSRQLAESSPYYEALKDRDVEVLFCYEPYDELVLVQLREFDKKYLTSVEKQMRQEKKTVDYDADSSGLSKSDADELVAWTKKILSGKAHTVQMTAFLDAHPCVLTVEEMASARHFVRTQFSQVPEEDRYRLLQPRFELNPRHSIIVKLNKLRTSDPELAELVVRQLFSNSMVAAGLVEDPRNALVHMNDLLAKALEKH
ncbi:unnamed protein product [Notodromas monacha]|uniref:Heat shock protein 75 kDa, mitochondrial n=1 Tax=Notodromas monacha TaxID=399045 RepID=A0A7R9BFC9_9CRUS|nr:unnamed protein product [Notodromas monacha]CAG0914382.1 unnamed protein product [Notodromas monacha]